MKSLKHIIFTLAMVMGLAFSVSAQKDDRPPKPKPPVVDPKPKPPRGNPPKGDDRPKKPGMSHYLIVEKRDGNIA